MSSLLDNSKLNKLVTELCKGFLMEGRGGEGEFPNREHIKPRSEGGLISLSAVSLSTSTMAGV